MKLAVVFRGLVSLLFATYGLLFVWLAVESHQVLPFVGIALALAVIGCSIWCAREWARTAGAACGVLLCALHCLLFLNVVSRPALTSSFVDAWKLLNVSLGLCWLGVAICLLLRSTQKSFAAARTAHP